MTGTNPLAQVLGPFTRTGGFYARSWGTYLDREPDELPVARPTIALACVSSRAIGSGSGATCSIRERITSASKPALSECEMAWGVM